MHVLFLHSYFTDPKGTVGVRSYDLCQGLIKKGHKVTVITQITYYNSNIFEGTKGFFRRLTLDGINIIGINIGYSNKMGMMARLFSFLGFMFFASIVALRVKGADIVFATSTPPTIFVPSLLVKWVRHKPFILELRDIWPDFIEGLDLLPKMPKFVFGLIDSIMKWVYKKADWVTTTTPGMTKIIANKGVDPKKLGTILLGARSEMFEGKHNPHPILQVPELKDKFIVCYIGSMSYSYVLDKLLDVAILMRDTDPNVAFLIVGRGKDEERLRERVKKENITNFMIAQAIEYNQVPSILLHVNVGYESSYPSPVSEPTLNNKFYDYMSAGLPTIINYDGDMGEFLKMRRCGSVAKTAEEAVKQIREWLNNPEELKKIAENAKKTALGELSRSHQVQLFVDLLEKHAKARER